jgi:hypothetical protein
MKQARIKEPQSLWRLERSQRMLQHVMIEV